MKTWMLEGWPCIFICGEADCGEGKSECTQERRVTANTFGIFHAVNCVERLVRRALLQAIIMETMSCVVERAILARRAMGIWKLQSEPRRSPRDFLCRHSLQWINSLDSIGPHQRLHLHGSTFLANCERNDAARLASHCTKS